MPCFDGELRALRRAVLRIAAEHAGGVGGGGEPNRMPLRVDGSIAVEARFGLEDGDAALGEQRR